MRWAWTEPMFRARALRALALTWLVAAVYLSLVALLVVGMHATLVARTIS